MPTYSSNLGVAEFEEDELEYFDLEPFETDASEDAPDEWDWLNDFDLVTPPDYGGSDDLMIYDSNPGSGNDPGDRPWATSELDQYEFTPAEADADARALNEQNANNTNMANSNSNDGGFWPALGVVGLNALGISTGAGASPGASGGGGSGNWTNWAVPLAATAVGGYLDYKGAKNATNAQVAAAQQGADAQLTASREANQLIRDQYNANAATLSPFIQGSEGSSQLQQAQSGALGPEAQQEAFNNYNESPGVAFMRERGLRGIDRNAAAQGSLIGGNRDKARIDYATGVAQQDYGNQFNRLGSVTQTGLSAANALAGVGTSAAQGQSQNTMNAGIGAANAFNAQGAAQAQGQLNKYNAFSSAFGDLGAIYGNRKNF